MFRFGLLHLFLCNKTDVEGHPNFLWTKNKPMIYLRDDNRINPIF